MNVTFKGKSRLFLHKCGKGRAGMAGMTLVEVVVSLALTGLTVSAIIGGYIMAAKRMDWASQNAAAQMSAVNNLERVRAAKWDTRVYPSVDEVQESNFAPRVEPFNLPIKGTNILYGTNFVEISTVSTDPPVKLIRVDCVWRSPSGELMTNSAMTYRSPDQ